MSGYNPNDYEEASDDIYEEQLTKIRIQAKVQIEDVYKEIVFPISRS